MGIAMRVGPTYFRDDEKVLRSILVPGGFFVDVGANVGANTLAAAALVGANGTVVAVEPHPRTAQFLRRNIDLNGFGNIATYQCAVGERPAVARLTDRDSDDLNEIAAEGGIEVQLATLDDLLAEHPGTIDLLKIDVEGYERFVFAGARATLARTREVYFECLDASFAHFGYAVSDVVSDIEAHGFNAFYAYGRGLDGRRIRKGEQVPPTAKNLLARRERRR